METNTDWKEEARISFVKEPTLYRRGIGFKTDYLTFRNDFIGKMLSLLGKGALHGRMRYHELISYLESTFQGLNRLKESAGSIRKRYYAKKLKKNKEEI